MRPVRVMRRPKKKERQRQKPNSGKLGIRRDHPRRPIEMKSCVVGGLQMVLRWQEAVEACFYVHRCVLLLASLLKDT